MRTPLVLSWSSGKDSALALHALRSSPDCEVVGLLTTISEDYRRISHHGVREELLDQQAAAIGLPLTKIYLPSGPAGPCANDVYERLMSAAMEKLKATGVHVIAFGDLFLADLRAWREANLAKANMRAVFPLWARHTHQLAREIIALGFKAYLTCVEGHLGPTFAGRLFDESLLQDLPPTVDPCGENGEFHTFVFDGPIFRYPVGVTVGPTLTRDGRHYVDLLPAGTSAAVDAAEIPPVGTVH
jgi:uncharacterized protein (TIGR00290 family)